MYVRLWQNIDSATCLLGSLKGLDFAYVNLHKVSAFVEGPKLYVRKVSVSL